MTLLLKKICISLEVLAQILLYVNLRFTQQFSRTAVTIVATFFWWRQYTCINIYTCVNVHCACVKQYLSIILTCIFKYSKILKPQISKLQAKMHDFYGHQVCLFSEFNVGFNTLTFFLPLDFSAVKHTSMIKPAWRIPCKSYLMNLSSIQMLYLLVCYGPQGLCTYWTDRWSAMVLRFSG